MALSLGVDEVSLAGDVQGDVWVGFFDVQAVEVDLGVGGDTISSHSDGCTRREFG